MGVFLGGGGGRTSRRVDERLRAACARPARQRAVSRLRSDAVRRYPMLALGWSRRSRTGRCNATIGFGAARGRLRSISASARRPTPTRARPLRAGVLRVRFGAHRPVEREHLHAHAERARFVVQHAREHAQRGGADRAMAVTGPGCRRRGRRSARNRRRGRLRRAAAADGARRRVAATTAGIERVAQLVRRLVEQAAAFAFGAERGDDAVDRAVELAQRARERGGAGVRRRRSRRGWKGRRARAIACRSRNPSSRRPGTPR